MKKIRIAFVISLAVLFLPSCQKETALNENLSNTLTFSATIENGLETRACLGDKTDAGYPVIWSENDSISVLCKENGTPRNDKLKLTQGAGTAAGIFRGECGKADAVYYAIYPYNAENKINRLSGLPIFSWSGSDQTAVKGNIDPLQCVMIAAADEREVVDGKVDVKFADVLSYVKFTINGRCGSVTLETLDENDYIAASTLYASVDVDGVPTLENYLDRTGKITLKAKDGGILEPGTYYIAVLPVTISGFKLTFASKHNPDAVYEKSTTKSVTFRRGNILNLGDIDLRSNLLFAGSGTSESPYEIYDIEDLEDMASVVNAGGNYASASYRLMNDIDCGGKTLTSIGYGDNSVRFSGTFDGDNHTISNYVAGECYWGTGLFGHVKEGTVKNLNVAVKAITSPKWDYTSNSAVSPLVAYASAYTEGKMATIENCEVSIYGSYLGSVEYLPVKVLSGDPHLYIGGIVGCAIGDVKISQCTNRVGFEVTTTLSESTRLCYVGGIIGHMSSSIHDSYCVVDRCRNNGYIKMDVTGTPAAGGIIGHDYDQSWDVTACITNCVNRGYIEVNGDSDHDSYAGGIIGYHDSDGSSSNGDPYILNCLSAASIYSNGDDSYSGGLVGYCYDDDTEISNCISFGNVSAGNDPHSGALCGTKYGTYRNCHWMSGNMTYGSSMGSDGTTPNYSPQTDCSKGSADATTMNSYISKLRTPYFNISYVSWTDNNAKDALDLAF